MSMPPLNGQKTHRLTDFAREELARVRKAPVPRMTLNPGVANRLLREGLVESVQMPSPYKSHRGRDCEHLRIAAPGLLALSLS